MARAKDRLHRVIVIGATPAGIAATNKLGELGIPVTLVDGDPDLDQKLAGEVWRLPSGLPLNFAHRSGLIRILRNPSIRCFLPARVDAIKHTPQGFRAKIRQVQTFVDPARCVLCGRCAEVCPVITSDGERAVWYKGRQALPGRPVIDKRGQPPCQEGCPLGVNAQAYIALTRAGRFKEALAVVRRDNVLPGICGRVCTHPCEGECRRGELDDPIAIRDIKRFLADYERNYPHEAIQGAGLDTAQATPAETDSAPGLHQTVAVIGSGPAGLAAASELARLGYGVTVYEKEAKAGGFLRYAIGPHRLPRDILDRELDYIERLGVQFKTSSPVDLSEILNGFKTDVDAVVLTTGAWTDRKLGVKGEDLDGVEGCISVLNRLYRDDGEEKEGESDAARPYAGKTIAVIGDGNAAFDLARVLRRVGAQVTILSWFPEDLIPADPEEVRGAREEGIAIEDRVQVVAFEGQNHRLTHLLCKPTQPGPPDATGVPWPVMVEGAESFSLPFDQAIVAIGQMGSLTGKNTAGENDSLKVTASGLVAVDETAHTGVQRIYAAGDGATGPSSVVQAMFSGKAAARAVHMDLSGKPWPDPESLRPQDRDFPEIPEDIPSLARAIMPERQPGARKDNFTEVALGLNETQVIFESERCLQCGVCSECLLCTEACEAIGAIDHAERETTVVEHAGVLIIADPEAAPPIKGEDVIRAYGPKAAKSNVNAMITRGFAAVANAMLLLRGTSQGLRGRGISFMPPDPELSPDIRMGVFVCQCNQSFGWLEEMDRYVKGLTHREDIVHAEVLPAACVPEGSAGILRMIREKGLTRVVLASCVCCPLDFVCSACTDQRSRLKAALFQGTGVSRAMVETCNVRGEVLRHIPGDREEAVKRFAGIIGRSMDRARHLKSLPSPMRTYNFATAVIGESEAAINSAMTLASAGFEVFMFGTRGKPLKERLAHPNVHCFENSTVTRLSGTLGDFQVFVETGAFSQVMQVGTVILGERSRRLIPYLPQEGLNPEILTFAMQQQGVPGTPFLYPGVSPIAGLFVASPPGMNVSQRKEGAAAAALAAAIMPRGPRQSKGFTVVIDEDRCRGCGRCVEICPYRAVSLQENAVDGWYAVVDEALCKGCGNCISVCPSNAADSPYRNQGYLERLLEEVLVE